MAEICAIVQKAFFIPSDFSVFDKLIGQVIVLKQLLMMA